MKNLLKPFHLVVLIFAVIALAACGTSETQVAQETGEITNKKLLVGTDAAFAPFEYMDKGEIVGFDIDLIAALMEEAGFDYQVNNLGWDPLFAALQGKEIDLAVSGITINDNRKQTYDFSNPYFTSTHTMVFNEGTDITNAFDLEGKRIGVQNGTTGQSAAEKIVGANHSSISIYETTAVAFMALQNGDVEVVVTDNVVANEYIKNNPQSNVVGVEDPENFEAEFYGLMFPKGSELKSQFDEALKTILENGTYAEIYQKWFGTEPNVELLLEIAE